MKFLADHSSSSLYFYGSTFQGVFVIIYIDEVEYVCKHISESNEKLTIKLVVTN